MRVIPIEAFFIILNNIVMHNHALWLVIGGAEKKFNEAVCDSVSVHGSNNYILRDAFSERQIV